MKKITLSWLGLIAILMATEPTALAQTKRPVSIKTNVQSNDLPMDPSVKTGRLANGFTYYIRKNTEPQKRAQLYLALKAGSILETEQQRGLAHFMEHMSFNGTKNFPKNELVDYLQKSGIRFGADLNAYTSFDETVYQLPIPTDDPTLFNNGLKIMRDWAQNALLETEEINKERGVILEEKRLGKGAMERMREKFLPVILNQSRYANRIPIGTDEVLNNFKPETIKAFYKDWYRPNLQALIIVGDIDVAKVETQVKAMFSDLKNPINAPTRNLYAIPLTGKNQYSVVSDKEMPITAVQLIIKRKAEVLKTKNDLRRSFIESLFNSMMASRFAELSKQADPPFVQAGVSLDNLLGLVNTATGIVVPKQGQFERGVKAMFTEVERVRRFGFVASELDRAKQGVLSALQVAYNEKDKTASDKYVKEYVQHFLKGEATPGISYEYNFAKETLPSITLAEVNAIVPQVFTETNRDVIVMTPEKEVANIPDEATFNKWSAEVKTASVAAYQDNTSNEPLLAATLPGSKVVAEKTVAPIGVTELTLANGIKVILKPTTFKNDEINFSGSSKGGLSIYEDKDFLSASFAPSLVDASGVGKFNAIQLPKMLTGKVLQVSPFINELSEGFSGGAAPKDIETALQLVYLYATQPRLDSDIFKATITNVKESIKHRSLDPTTDFKDTINAVMGSYNFRTKAPSNELIDMISQNRALEIYKDRFSDFSDYVFVFVGNFKVETLKPLLEKYLGSLPATQRKENFVDRNIYPLRGKVTKTVYRGKEDKATVRMVFSGDMEYSDSNRYQLDALTEVMKIKLIQRLREEEGGVYSPQAGVSVSRNPKGFYSFTVIFGCAPANVDKLINSTLDEIAKLRKNGATAVDIDKYKAEEKRQVELAEKTNGFWLSSLSSIYTENEDPLKLTRLDEIYKNASSEGVKEFANKYLNGDNLIIFKLLPEQK